MNFEQAPQGPVLNDCLPIPEAVRAKVDEFFKYMFNPMDEQVHAGMAVMKQNIAVDVPDAQVEVLDFPEETDVLRMLEDNWDDVVGISIGSEPLIMKATEFAARVRASSKNKQVRIVFRNYGVASGKTAGMIPDGPKVSHPAPHIVVQPKTALGRFVTEKLGLTSLPKDAASLVVSVGCPNRCYFCNTAKMMGGAKLDFLKTPEEIFEELCRYMDSRGEPENVMPGLNVTILDENFTRPMDKMVKLCELIKESGRDIRFMVFGDIAGLHNYLEDHGDFRSS